MMSYKHVLQATELSTLRANFRRRLRRRRCGFQGRTFAMLFFTHEAAMKNQQDQDADRYRRVGDVEDWPTRKMIPEDVHINEIYVDEIYDLAIKQSPIVEQHAVEDPVDKIADCAAKDHCKRESEKKPFIPHLVEVEQDADTRNDGKDREEQFPAEVDAESHAGVLDIRKAR